MKSKYRSGLEEKTGVKLPKDYLYEPYQIPYIVNRNYLPDFVHEEKKVLIECKGFFRSGDIQKYKAIRDYLSEWELIFVLSNFNKKIRKNSKTTMNEWMDKEGFLCYTINMIDELKKYIRQKKP